VFEDDHCSRSARAGSCQDSGAAAAAYGGPVRYLFHVHRTVPHWRLVTREDTGMPPRTTPEQWRRTRARTADDTNPDIVREVDAKGWALFKVGGDFADVEADVARTAGGSGPPR
jgi:hypothetical protein